MAKFIRRLQRIGSSILVSLPKEWVDANGLEKGAPVELETGDGTVFIAPNREGGHRRTKELVIPYPLPPDENIAADITGGYLLGHDIITIRSKKTIPAGDRERVRASMRRLVGMEIVEEDASNIRMQFLLDPGTISPDKLLKRISSIALGMFNDVLMSLISEDRSNLATLQNRDLEVNRQYFLLVRLIRSTVMDIKLANTFNLENIDILDYRVAANLLENGGDTIVQLGQAVLETGTSRKELAKLYGAAKNFEDFASKSIDSFVNHDRPLAIEAIAAHRQYQQTLSEIRTPGGRSPPSVDFLDLVYMFERVGKSWEDVVDLVKPIYAKS